MKTRVDIQSLWSNWAIDEEVKSTYHMVKFNKIHKDIKKVHDDNFDNVVKPVYSIIAPITPRSKLQPKLPTM